MGARPAGRGPGDYISPACAFWFEQVEAERRRLIASIAAYDEIAEEVPTEIATARAISHFLAGVYTMCYTMHTHDT